MIYIYIYIYIYTHSYTYLYIYIYTHNNRSGRPGDRPRRCSVKVNVFLLRIPEISVQSLGES